MEIMVALVLIALIFLLIPTSSDQRSRRSVDEVAFELDRAVRFATDEAILRNVTTRIKINLSKEPQEYVVEYGSSGNIPLPEEEDVSKMSIQEREFYDKKIKSFDSLFTKTEEFSKGPKAFNENCKILGIATTHAKEILDYGEASIYFYPTGEKDGSLIVLSTESEMATLDIPSYQEGTILNYSPFSKLELENLENSQENKLKEFVLEWRKK